MAEPVTPNTIEDQPLPESATWETLINAPTSLADVSISDANALDAAAQAAADAEAGLDDLAIQGWAFDGVFTATGQQSVSWTSGTLRFKDGTSFSISSGSMSGLSTSVPTYLYFDKAVSTTALQNSTTASNAVGQNKVLMGSFQGNSASGKLAIFQVFGGAGGQSPYISGQNIVAGSIFAANIAAGTITANEIATNTITANRLSVSQLSAIAADLGSITAGTVTGALIRTASSGTRVQLDNSSNEIQIYNGSTKRARGTSVGWDWYNSSGSLIGSIFATSQAFDGFGTLNALTLDATPLSNGSIYLGTDDTGAIGMNIGVSGSTQRLLITQDLTAIGDADDYSHEVHIFGELRTENGLWDTNAGTMSSSGVITDGGTNALTMSVSHSTGIYTISHGLGTSSFAALITLRNSTATLLATVSAKSSSSYTVRIGNTSGTLTDAAFDFFLVLYN